LASFLRVSLGTGDLRQAWALKMHALYNEEASKIYEKANSKKKV